MLRDFYIGGTEFDRSIIADSFVGGATMGGEFIAGLIGKGVAYGTSEDFITGAQANEQFNLSTSKFEDDEKVPFEYAQMLGEREAATRADQEFYALTREQKNLPAAQEFLGSLAGGFFDPVNWATGGLATIGIRTAGKALGVGLLSNFGKAAVGTGWQAARTIIGTNIAESLVTTPLIEGAQDIAFNESWNWRDFAYELAIDAMVGSGLQYGGSKIYAHIAKKHGSRAKDALYRQAAHDRIIFDSEAKPNEEFSPKLDEIAEQQRSTQRKYDYVPITDAAGVQDATFYMGKLKNDTKMFKDMEYGDNALVLIDNYNTVHNTVSPTTAKGSSGMVYSVRLKDAKIAHPTENLVNVKAGVFELMTKSGYLRNAKDANALELKLSEDLNFDDVQATLGEFMPGEKFLFQETFNNLIKDLGFDGYYVHGVNSLNESSHNGLVYVGDDITISKNFIVENDTNKTDITLEETTPISPEDKAKIENDVGEHMANEMARIGDPANNIYSEQVTDIKEGTDTASGTIAMAKERADAAGAPIELREELAHLAKEPEQMSADLENAYTVCMVGDKGE